VVPGDWEDAEVLEQLTRKQRMQQQPREYCACFVLTRRRFPLPTPSPIASCITHLHEPYHAHCTAVRRRHSLYMSAC
jgi:hypothetical protein